MADDADRYAIAVQNLTGTWFHVRANPYVYGKNFFKTKNPEILPKDGPEGHTDARLSWGSRDLPGLSCLWCEYLQRGSPFLAGGYPLSAVCFYRFRATGDSPTGRMRYGIGRQAYGLNPEILSKEIIGEFPRSPERVPFPELEGKMKGRTLLAVAYSDEPRESFIFRRDTMKLAAYSEECGSSKLNGWHHHFRSEVVWWEGYGVPCEHHVRAAVERHAGPRINEVVFYLSDGSCLTDYCLYRM